MPPPLSRDHVRDLAVGAAPRQIEPIVELATAVGIDLLDPTGRDDLAA
jgi:hypothetical protein